MRKILSKEFLKQHWTVTVVEKKIISNKNRAARLIVAAKLKYLKLENRFPESIEDIPSTALRYIAKQLELIVEDGKKYSWDNRTSRKHNTLIKSFLGYNDYTMLIKQEFTHWLVNEKISEGKSKAKLVEDSLSYFKENKILTPRPARLERDISSIIKKFDQTFFKNINSLLSNTVKKDLDSLPRTQLEDSNQSVLSFLKRDTGGISLDTLFESLKRLDTVKSFNIESKIFKIHSWDLLKKYSEKVSVERLMDLDRRDNDVKYGLLACFLYTRKLEITDYLVDIVMKITNNLHVRAEKKADKVLLKEAKEIRLDEKMGILKDISVVSIGNPKKTIEDAIYPVASKSKLQKIADSDKPISHKEKQYKFIHSSYSHHYRRMLAPLLSGIKFLANNPKDNDILKSLSTVKLHMLRRKKTIKSKDVLLDGIVPKNCRSFICTKDEVRKNYYEICALTALRDGLRCKEIWVEDAYRYRDPQEDVHKDFYDKPDYYFEIMKQPREVNKFIDKAKNKLNHWMNILSKGFSKNSKMLIETKNNKSRIKLLKSKPQVSPKNIERLKSEVQAQWSETTLLDIVKEVDFKINFSDDLTSIGGRSFADFEEQRKRKLLCVYGLGTNIGLKRARSADPTIDYEQLRHTHTMCLTINNVRDACARITNETLKIRDELLWGSSSLLCSVSDAGQFPVWEKNAMTEWHIRNGGKGVMAYWHTDKKSLCIYSQLKKCSSSEAASMIKGILYHLINAEIESNCVDTRGQNLAAFGFSYTLDFALLCRFKSISSQKLFSSETNHSYKAIEKVISRAINWKLIEKYYEQIIMYSVALKLKKAEPEAILKVFTSNNLKQPVFQAIQELGRVAKTIFLCRYLHSEKLRINIRETLNVIERWNGVNDFIFYGKRGVISTNNTTHQELSILCLQIMQACMVYINTLMIQRILELKRWHNVLTSVDKRALSPLIYEHINPYGKFTLDMEQRINFMVSDD